MFKKDNISLYSYLKNLIEFFIIQGSHLLWQDFSLFFDKENSWFFSKKPFPGSLATTTGISVDVFSSSYLDVSVHWVSYSIKGFPFGYPWISRCFVFPHGVSLRFTSCFLCQGIRFILFILFVFFLFFYPHALWVYPFDILGLYEGQYKTVNTNLPRTAFLRSIRSSFFRLLAEEGFEPPTCRLWFCCSYQLNYPAFKKRKNRGLCPYLGAQSAVWLERIEFVRRPIR